jgi:acyl transferase domain-containing protein
MVANMVTYSEPRCALVSNVTGKVAEPGTVTNGDYWRDHVRAAVDFNAGMNAVNDFGCDVFLEIGASPVLVGMGKRCIPADSGEWVESVKRGQDDSACVLKSIAKLYAAGAPVDLASACGYSAETTHHAVPLPAYPFDKTRCWLEHGRDPYGPAGTSAGAGAATNGAGVITPIIGRAVQTPLQQTIFETKFNTVNLPLLGDHVLHHTVVVPGAAYISMAISAVVHMHPAGPHRLQHVTFPQALVLPDAPVGRSVQLVFENDSTESGWNLHSLDGDSWVEHAQGSLSVRPADMPDPTLPSGYLNQIRARCIRGEMPCTDQPWSDELYRVLWDREYHLQTRFRWLGHIWRGDREAVAEMRMPLAEDGAWSDFELFPGLIDSCFQLLASTAFDEFQGTTFIPMWCDQYNYFGKPAEGTQLYCHAVERKQAEHATKDAMGADIWLFDSNGNKVLEIVNIRMKKAGATVSAM